jgi:hypothetical protein
MCGYGVQLPKPASPRTDWLIDPSPYKAKIEQKGAEEVVLTNGLVRRTLRLSPNVATVAFDNLSSGESLLRGVKPEARLTIDGKEYAVGGLTGQPDYAYLRPEWIPELKNDPAAFQYDRMETGPIQARFPWKHRTYSPELPWPAPGIALTLFFRAAQPELQGVEVRVHYELYDGLPLISKWVTVHNGQEKPVPLNTITTEVLALDEGEPSVEDLKDWRRPNLFIESDYSFGGFKPKMATKTVNWVTDPQYTTQINFELKSPALLECRTPQGPDLDIAPGDTFVSCRTFELALEGTNRERNSLAQRRMYRTLAPWSQENPLLLHVTSSKPQDVRLAIDQCAEVGFEMLIMSFGSGFNAESEDPAYRASIKGLVDYAHSKNIVLGGYSLLASRRIDDENDAINPKTGKPGGAIFGNSPCLESQWGQNYFRKLKAFYEATGLDVLEHDGSYPGDVCASTKHPGHKGEADSQCQQWRTITDFYKWCRGRGIYLNVPDWYFLNGSNKTAMGYREDNWSLPRDRQIVLGRQNIFDGTWDKTPSMGWMFVPLVQYHGGGAAATLEPLAEHLDAYSAHLTQNLGSGVQACYRGPRLFDKPETKALVQSKVAFFKKYRPILESDVIHVQRPDGRQVDCMLHVNPRLEQKGFAEVFNPLSTPVKTSLRLPLYYTGLTDRVKVREQEGMTKTVALNRQYEIEVPVELAPGASTWFVIESGD